MRAKREYRNRDETQVAVLDALASRNGDGMTVFELRARVDADIDDLEDALADLKADGLITAESGDDDRTVITADERVFTDEPAETPTVFDRLREVFGF